MITSGIRSALWISSLQSGLIEGSFGRQQKENIRDRHEGV